MRIEVRPPSDEHAAQWRCTAEDCDQRDQWHIVSNADDAFRDGLDHATEAHGTTDVWFFAQEKAL